MSQDSSKPEEEKSPWIQVLELWIRCKKDAIKSGEWDFYKQMLEDCRRDYSKIYKETDQDWKKKLLEELIQIASCEIREINIKYKSKKMPF